MIRSQFHGVASLPSDSRVRTRADLGRILLGDTRNTLPVMASAAASKSVERSTLLSEYRLDPDAPIQFRDGDAAKPWKKVALAIALLGLGSLLLSLGLGFWFTGQPNCESRTACRLACVLRGRACDRGMFMFPMVRGMHTYVMLLHASLSSS